MSAGAAAGSAFGSILSGLIASSSARRQQRRQMQFNAREAEKDRNWQQMMSSTAFTRAVEDLGRAGLNPILATGKQASTPGGATASYSGDSASEVNSALAAMRTVADIDLTSAMTEKAEAETGLTKNKEAITGGASRLVTDASNLYDAGKDVIQREGGRLMDKIGGYVMSGAKNVERTKNKMEKGFNDWVKEKRGDFNKGTKNIKQKAKDYKQKAKDYSSSIYRKKGWIGPNLENGRPQYEPIRSGKHKGKWYDHRYKRVTEMPAIRKKKAK